MSVKVDLINIDHLQTDMMLGSGGVGAVFKGVWQQPNGTVLDVAIKKIRIRDLAQHDYNVDKVVSELYIMRSFSGESNFCTMHGMCIVGLGKDMEVWIVMEYADGGDLHNFMEEYKGSLTREMQLNLILQASKALQILHNGPSPILHRDIKSFNFLVQRDTQTLLLTDFGLSKPVKLTNSKTPTVGSLRWMAPEIVKYTSNRIWTTKADIYSLGMVFYEILTGKLPYEEIKDTVALMEKIRKGTLPKFPQDCPRDLTTLIRKCCKKNPEKRLNINELVLELEILCKRSPLGPIPLGPIEPNENNSTTRCQSLPPTSVSVNSDLRKQAVRISYPVRSSSYATEHTGRKSPSFFSRMFRNKKAQESATDATQSTSANEANASTLLLNIEVEEEEVLQESK